MRRYLIFLFPSFKNIELASKSQENRREELAPVPPIDASLEKEANRLSKEMAAEAKNDDDMMKALLAEYVSK